MVFLGEKEASAGLEKLSELSGDEPDCWLDWRPALAFAFAASMECLLGRGCGSWTGSLIKGSVCRRLRSHPFSLADLVGVTSVVMEADEVFSSSMALSPSVARLSLSASAAAAAAAAARLLVCSGGAELDLQGQRRRHTNTGAAA